MTCNKCIGSISCNAIQNGPCSKCGKTFTTWNAPPLNKVCKECSDKYDLCESCGKEIN